MDNPGLMTTGAQAEIAATGVPPTNDLEAGLVEVLRPGVYTALVLATVFRLASS